MDARDHLRIIRYRVIQGDLRRQRTRTRANKQSSDKLPELSISWKNSFKWQTRGDQEWTARSPDLTVCDFLLWVYLKQQIWSIKKAKTLRQLKAAITAEWQNLNPAVIFWKCVLSILTMFGRYKGQKAFSYFDSRFVYPIYNLQCTSPHHQKTKFLYTLKYKLHWRLVVQNMCG